MSEPEVVVLADAAAVARAAAERVAEPLAGAVATRGVAHWATSGGSAPAAIYRALAAPRLRLAVPWDRVHLWWADDRYVPRDDPLSNVRSADVALLGPSGVGIPPADVHPFPCGEAIRSGAGAAWCAERYGDELRSLVPVGPDGWPVFDLVMLGVGMDGHILSVFPGSAAFDSPALALAIPAPIHIEPHVPRVTLNPSVIDAARSVLVVAHGKAKTEVLALVLGPERDERRWPAQRARRAGATWLLDEAAAGGLTG